MSTISREYMREYYKKNNEYLKKQKREYYEKNKDYILDKQKEYNEKNREERLIKQREYNRTHKEERKARDKARREEIRKVENEYRRQRYANDPAFRILISCRTRIRKALEGIGEKIESTKDLIGCPIEQLKSHLESQFVEGMTWDNYGEWHIDHILPCASFDLTDPEQQKECFHYTNLQPLWAVDNLSKGASVD